jgi:RimJ/RimL family protein N-acetyltransferase
VLSCLTHPEARCSDDLATFARVSTFMDVSAGSPHQPELAAYLDTLVEQRCTRPEWWVVDGSSRAALWSLPGVEVPSSVVLIETDWDDPQLRAGRALMARVHELAAGLGAEALDHMVDSPPVAPQHQERPEERVALLEATGYELLRDGLRWLLSSPSERAEPGPLTFRTIADVGEDGFVDAIAATLEGTADSELTLDVEEHGAREAARRYLEDHQSLEHRPEWFELAYGGGDLVGVIMGARNPTSAVIAYVGVVPEERGSGFAAPLVRRGTARLAAAGATEIRGDCDRDNVAMAKAFERAGYARFARRRSFRHTLRPGVVSPL